MLLTLGNNNYQCMFQPEAKPQDLFIYSITGQLLKSIAPQGSQTIDFDLTEFQQGVYFLNISGYKSMKLVR